MNTLGMIVTIIGIVLLFIIGVFFWVLHSLEKSSNVEPGIYCFEDTQKERGLK